MINIRGTLGGLNLKGHDIIQSHVLGFDYQEGKKIALKHDNPSHRTSTFVKLQSLTILHSEPECVISIVH